jgi:hypothetical protein
MIDASLGVPVAFNAASHFIDRHVAEGCSFSKTQ